jgi:hypothetical protein
MNRPLILAAAIVILAPAASAAQGNPAAEERQPVARLDLSKLPDATSAEDPAVAAARQPRAPMARAERRRRGSMVGYIEDATIASQLRVRFDAGFGNDRPDRAEFFYAKCGCYVFDPPPFNDPDTPGPGPGVPTELDFQQFYVQGEYAASERLSVFAELPFRAIQPQGFLPFGSPYDPFPDHSGFGDIRAGAKFSLVSDDMRDVTVQVRAGFPTGDASKGLSTDTFNLEPALLYQQSLTDRVALEAQIGGWFPFGGSDGVDSPDKFSGSVIFYGIGPSFDLVDTDRVRFSPVVELVGWRVIGGFQTGCEADLTCTFDADDNIANLKLGARTSFEERHSLYVGYGFALTSAEWYDKIIRFEYRYRF